MPSSSYRNPCPTGTGMGYETINNVIYLICSPAFKRTDYTEPAVELGLGLGLGLGIPLMFVLIGICFRCYWIRRLNRPNRRLNPPPAVTPAVPTEADNYEAVRQKLSPISFNEFLAGNMSESLLHDLMIVRTREKRDLRDFIALAKQRRHPELASWLEQLNPTTIPPEVRREAYQGSPFVTIGESDPIPSLPAPASAPPPPDTKISISYPTAVATASALTPGQQVTLAMMEARPYHEQYVQRERTALDDYLKYSSENKK